MKSYVPFLSLRYLWFHKASSALGILGVTLGVGLVIVVVGVMDGFQARLRRSLIGNTAAVVVRPYYDVDADRLVELLKTRVPGVLDASPIVKPMTLVSSPRRRIADGLPCQVLGVDAARENSVSGLGEKLRRGETKDSPLSLIGPATVERPFQTPDSVRYLDQAIRPEKQGVLLGKGLGDRLAIRPGDSVRLFTLLDRKGGKNDPRSVAVESEEFFVTGLYNSGDSEVDRLVLIMDRRDALSFFSEALRTEAAEIRLLLADPDQAEAVKWSILGIEPVTDPSGRILREGKKGLVEELVSGSLREKGLAGARPLEVYTWMEIHRTVLSAVANERSLLIVITSFSFLVVAFLIGSTQSMLVVEKTREIGVLRSLGASVAGTSGVFLGNGLFIGTFGAAAGSALGTAVATNVAAIASFIHRYFGHELFPSDIYRFNEVPIDVRPDFVLSICAGAVVFALLGSLLPAVRAARLDPVESLHHE